MNKERKYILLFGALLLIAGAVYRFAPEAETLFSGRDEIRLKEKKLARYREIVQEKEKIVAGLESARSELARLESGLLTGETPALAAVEIQNIVNEIASQSQVEIQSMQILQSKSPASSKDSLYLPIPVQVNLATSIRQLKEMLYRIENAAKFLKISSIRIRPQRRGKTESVQSSFTVEGFMKEKKDTAEG